MYNSQWIWADLFWTLHEYDGANAYEDVLYRWLWHNFDECRWIGEFQRRTNENWASATDEDLCRLYAMFRVTSILLLSFQADRSQGIDYQGPAITIEDFQLFHEQLGFHVPDATAYHPFFHEIVCVTQAPNEDAPFQVEECAWPCLMLGNLMFCRAGSTITGGLSHVVKEVTESSTLYWTYRRKDRPCEDLSHGWGHNSQWRTRLRRDYRTANPYHFNVDGDKSLNDCEGIIDDLPVATMIELVRNRCVIKTRIDASDLDPYDYAYTEVV